ncbi:TPA: methyltransferase domain-containing protein [Candidatus Woesearchaeota archaeon]|nr:hypothetical protein [uncultured archaeon]MBS3172817.1 methyltransferase domain-containing protein [Candidatus Woesearchaeota archaeon]HIH32432.1 methyltransferase domain-containing protein [Candidatus Woesearchaeota archaeon]HIH54544.1 methyltransferase domain-containing protein [Candidatus Woesearchaeota archaeon]HIJ02234.1 methyltransferase domain-containing protein [Candidatus Woesearchaeota archaeon]
MSKRYKSTKLNIGCGHQKLKGWVNLDINAEEGIDAVHDLDKYPYPFNDESFEEIRAYSIIEHLKDPVKTVEELHRILKPGGTLDIIVPHYTSAIAWGNPTHLRPYSYDTFFFFVKNSEKEKYTTVEFSSIKVDFRFAKRFLIWNYLIEMVANWFPHLYENTPLYMFPAMGLRIRLVK